MKPPVICGLAPFTSIALLPDVKWAVLRSYLTGVKSSGEPVKIPRELPFTNISKSSLTTSSMFADFIVPWYSICFVMFPSPTYPPKYAYSVLDELDRNARVENPVAPPLPPTPLMTCLSVKMFSAVSKGVEFLDARSVSPYQIPMFSFGDIGASASAARFSAIVMLVT